MGCKEFKEKQDQFQIDLRSLYFQNGKDFSNKLDREFLNSEFEFKPVIRFSSIKNLLSLIILDETKNDANEFTLSISPMSKNDELIEVTKKKIGVQASTFIQIKNDSKKLFIYKNDKTLAQSQVSDNDKLIVYITDEEPKEDKRIGIPQGFEFKQIPFVDFSNKNAFTRLGYSKDPPENRILQRGLNIEGKCQNQNCRLRGLLQISPQGLGNTEIISRFYYDTYCINKGCKGNLFEVETCGFYDCRYQWKGLKFVEGKLVKVGEGYQITEAGIYTRINPKNKDGSSNRVFWTQLWIEAIQIQPVCQFCCQSLKSEEGVPFEICDNKNVHLSHKKCMDEFKIISNLENVCFACIK